MTNLFDYEDVEAPILKHQPRRHIRVPAPEMHGVAGTVGVLRGRDEVAYLSKRTREEHFYRKHRGYAVSDHIIDYLDRKGVNTVLIAEEDTRTVYEYHIKDFRDHGIDTTDEPGDPQTCVPVSFAARTWENHAAY
ncbi:MULTISPECIES: hypothetical protein [unclassified Halorubrum]|uniref:hypothetical protein n=1 Tax=unclassified Halorubrum TaxID=2642239 RepID=UPI00190964F7|nr:MULTISPECIES: hypothetical protein [unclassified Halorubrum]